MVDFELSQCVSRAFDARSCSGGTQQRAPGEEEVGEGEEAVELGGAFGKAPVARFAVPEDVFKDVEGMLHSRPHLRFGPLQIHGQLF